MAAYKNIESKFLFDQLLELMVRLYEFCSIRSDHLNLDLDIDDRIDDIFVAVFKKDLLIFAATLRNFSEQASLVGVLKNIQLADAEIDLENGPPYFREKDTATDLYRCVSRILHSRTIETHRGLLDFILAKRTADDEISGMISEQEKKYDFDSDKQLFQPLLELETKVDGIYFVSLETLLKGAGKFLGKVLDAQEQQLLK